MKTRQQRLAEERAGHPPSPPQKLVDDPRGSRRTRAKKPSATVAVGSVQPAAEPAVPREPQALLQVWPDAARAGDNPTHTFVVSVSSLPEVMACLKAKGTNQVGLSLLTTSSASAQTTNSSSKNQKSQFMSPPLELLTKAELPHNLRNQAHLPAYTKDGMVLYGVAQEAPTPGLVASSKNTHMAQEPSDEASASDAIADGDTDMNEDGESGSSTGHSAESFLDEDASESDSTTGHLTGPSLPQATQSILGPSSMTPRGSRWGRWFHSARSSLTSRFGFSRLTPVSERSEPTTPLTQATRTAAMSPIHRNEEEVQRAQIGESDPSILWPSRSLERMQTSQKRKRWGEPVEQEPVKLRRIGDKGYFSSQQSQVKTPIAITNPAGTFKVPSPSDSDWSDSDEGERGFRVPSPINSDASDSDEEEANVIAKVNKNLGPAGGQNLHAYQQWCKTATPAVIAALESMEVNPQIAAEAFERGFEKLEASGDTFKSVPQNLQPFTPLSQYGISPRVEAYLDSQWDEDDHRAAVAVFERGFQIFQENGAAATSIAT